MNRTERARFLAQHPREQVITKTDLAKVENVWRCLPHTVSLGSQKNFMAFAEWVGARWEQSDADFNEEYFHRAISRVIVFRHTERLVSRQPWYQGGYRANIVAYAVAKLSAMIAARAGDYELDYAAIWARQSISAPLERQLTEIATAVFDVIVHPPDGFQNVTEWCKKEACWRRVVELPLELRSEMEAELVDARSDRRRRGEARAQQKVDNRIDTQIQVVGLGRNYWEALAAWARERKLINGEENRLLLLAVRMPVRVPTERESARLLDLKSRIELEGFRAA
jgi:hypothetical protein